MTESTVRFLDLQLLQEDMVLILRRKVAGGDRREEVVRRCRAFWMIDGREQI